MYVKVSRRMNGLWETEVSSRTGFGFILPDISFSEIFETRELTEY